MIKIALRLLIAIFLSSLALTACGNKEPVEVEIAQQRTQDAKQVASATQGKLEEVEKERDRWKSAFFLVLVLGVLAHLAGIALGSRARKQAERARRNE